MRYPKIEEADGDMMKEEMIIQFLDSLNKTMDGE